MADVERFVLDPGALPPAAKPDEPPLADAAAPRRDAAAPAAPEPMADPAAPADVTALGRQLARALPLGLDGQGYQPVIVFGTSNSGKTALLLSLLATIMTDHRLETGLALADPLLGETDPASIKMHQEAVLTFQNRAQDFIKGLPIQKTSVELPFFVPVTVTPRGKQRIGFAFLESNGEWYRPNRSGGQLFPKLQREIESFIFHYQGPIIFLYLLPYTQAMISTERNAPGDADQIEDASLAMVGALDGYDRARENFRDRDQHLMLVTKWDVHTRKKSDRAAALEADRGELMTFCSRHYHQALAKFRGLTPDRAPLPPQAYCAGFMNEHGVLQNQQDEDIRMAISSHPIRMWNWLYRTTLANIDQPVCSPFPEPRKPIAIIRFITALLDKVTG